MVMHSETNPMGMIATFWDKPGHQTGDTRAIY
jgi:hypothetical protein